MLLVLTWWNYSTKGASSLNFQLRPNQFRLPDYVRRPKNLAKIRARLNADDLEQRLFAEFEKALELAGYFLDLERDLKELAKEKSRGQESEVARVQKELDQVNGRIRVVWDSQSKMELSVEGLRLVSEELNRLAKQKQDLDAYLAGIASGVNDPAIYRHQALFVENNIRACLQGWAKATTAKRKRLLRRTIKEIVVTRGEMRVVFWLSADEVMDANGGQDPIGSGSDENLLPFRRRSLGGKNRNLKVRVSGNVRSGCGGRI